MGLGEFLDAEYDLKADVPSGTYHIVLDSIIIRSVDATYELIHRRGATDTQLATWAQHWEPLPGGVYTAQAYEIDIDAPAIDCKEGDQLVFRYKGDNTTLGMAYIPNGDGHLTNGRIPNITLPTK